MGRIEKTVFISYRRTNFPWAYCIYQDLTHHGFDVFFDYQSIDSGNFGSVILDNIRARAHFIVILAPSALKRCHEPGDWFRREIETAIDEKRNIIPVMLESFDFGSPLVKKSLAGKLACLSSYNGLSLIAEYMDAGLEKLRNRYLNIALEDIHLHVLTESAKEITESQKAAANEAPPVENLQLSAQEWFEKGYIFREAEDWDEAIRCFTEAIRLEPNFAKAYSFRGDAFRAKNDLASAMKDHNESVRLRINAGDAFAAYGIRGYARESGGDLPGAIEDYTRAINMKSDEPSLYDLRGLARMSIGDLDGAMKDFDTALSFRPNKVKYYQGSDWEKTEGYSSAKSECYKVILNCMAEYKVTNQEEVEKINNGSKPQSVKKKSLRKETKLVKKKTAKRKT